PGIAHRIKFNEVRAAARCFGRDTDPEVSAWVASDRSPDALAVGNFRRHERVSARCAKRIRWRKAKYASRKRLVTRHRCTNRLSPESIARDKNDRRDRQD